MVYRTYIQYVYILGQRLEMLFPNRREGPRTVCHHLALSIFEGGYCVCGCGCVCELLVYFIMTCPPMSQTLSGEFSRNLLPTAQSLFTQCRHPNSPGFVSVAILLVRLVDKLLSKTYKKMRVARTGTPPFIRELHV